MRHALCALPFYGLVVFTMSYELFAILFAMLYAPNGFYIFFTTHYLPTPNLRLRGLK